MKLVYRPWGVIAIAVGAAYTGIEAWGSGEYLLAQQGGWNYIVIGGIGVTAGSALLPFFAEKAWASKDYLRALALWLLLPLALSITFLAALDRIGKARDTDAKPRQDQANRIAIAQDAVAKAEVKVVEDESEAKSECRSGRRKKCLDREEEAEASRQRLIVYRETLAKLGAPGRDAQASRVTAMLPFITEQQVDTFQPLLLPVALAVISALLVAVGSRAQRRPVEAPSAGRNSQKGPTALKEETPPGEPLKGSGRPRKRGRPSKLQINPEKRGRGRPRKDSLPAGDNVIPLRKAP